MLSPALDTTAVGKDQRFAGSGVLSPRKMMAGKTKRPDNGALKRHGAETLGGMPLTGNPSRPQSKLRKGKVKTPDAGERRTIARKRRPKRKVP